MIANFTQTFFISKHSSSPPFIIRAADYFYTFAVLTFSSKNFRQQIPTQVPL